MDPVNESEDKESLFNEGPDIELAQADLGTLQEAKGISSAAEKPSLSSGWLGFISLDYYQSFFDVTSSQVIERILAGMVPGFKSSLVEKLNPTPDLYGPFWLAMTLTLTVALSSNLSRLLNNVEHWEFHFNEVTLIGSLIYGYTWLVPCLLWAWLWWRGNRLRYTLLQLIAIYGYSLSIFIPLTLLWLINSELVRWMLLAVSVSLSGWVLLSALWRPLKTESFKMAVCVLTVAALLHSGLWIGFKFIYFSSLVSSDSFISFNNVTVNHQ